MKPLIASNAANIPAAILKPTTLWNNSCFPTTSTKIIFRNFYLSR